ncbi:AAA-domain-containing protein [Choiromyces venosus 120613-1]|uniref:AAA-domain-containing protein n=1 Tax=Choiromyces venosus 120613-1 TaxID=1336337 RepID=A0A3N4JRP7_9PEZI|nr:AAA-domain-containing protein [Choiromyces venosus 120613-1]
MQTITRRAISSLIPLPRRALIYQRLPLRSSLPAIRPFHLSRNASNNSKTPPIAATESQIEKITNSASVSRDSTQRTSEEIQVMPEGESVYVTEPVAERVVATDTGGDGGNGGSDGRPRARGRPVATKRRITVTPRDDAVLPLKVPEWFMEQRVRLLEDEAALVPRAVITSSASKYSPPTVPGASPDYPPPDTPLEELNKQIMTRYLLEENVWREIVATLRAGLTAPKRSSSHSLAAMKSHCILHSPIGGSVYQLDAIVNKVAQDVGADVIRIDPLDFEELLGESVGDSRLGTSSPISSFSIRSLGYDIFAAKENKEDEESTEESEEEDYEEDTEPQEAFIPGRRVAANWSQWSQLLESGQIPIFASPLFSVTAPPDPEQASERSIERANEQKIWSILESMISANQIKRTKGQPASDSESSEAPKEEAPSNLKTIIHVRDFRELERNNSGQAILRIFYEVILKRRNNGENIVVIGTSSAEEGAENYLTRPGLLTAQLQSGSSFERTIIVPAHPLNPEYRIDKMDRFREINMRHLGDLLRRKSGENGQSVTLEPVPVGFEAEEEFDLAVPSAITNIWNFEHVHRLCTFILGELNGRTLVTRQGIKEAINILDRSDSAKIEWAMAADRAEQELVDIMTEIEQNEAERVAMLEGRPLKKKLKLPKNCTAHEKKLLGGVVDPTEIRTGFSSVRAPEETIEALKTLTSLSLIRPEAFKYGVLATDRIPGVLLYGPPGTGKTLLARAVAKESGATVLEVSGSEVFDMYVGEGEKNVKAIFSLAKKLSPCVVFIDEADAIFGSRHSHSTRTTHREIINQFLKEWADMQSTAFIMVATNRPFDLDDAVLRRLPRRILVDLPTVDDRREILKIHLAAEVLTPSVSLQSLAEQTTLFSGSDLKNLCVSAALACVREENAAAAKAKAEEQSFTFPEKRTLEERHFQKALQEITASISDDMSSLTAIRKFDEKYGEKTGKRKKTPHWGFGIGDSAESKGTGRVRAD